MNILAISGSLRVDSSNTALLRSLAALAPPTVRVTFYSDLDSMPHYSPERDGCYASSAGGLDHSPEPVKAFRAQCAAADGFVICTPEYAYGLPGSLKNALDWLVSSGELWRKPVAALSASPSARGGEHAHAALLLTLTALEAAIVADASLSVPFVRTKLGLNGTVTDPETRSALQSSLIALVEVCKVRSTELPI